VVVEDLRGDAVYDAIVVGSRCAGAPTAMLLARRGHRVLLVDRSTFPSDTVSSHYLHAPGLAKLGEWGLLEPLLATGCPPIRRLTLGIDDGSRSLWFDEPLPSAAGLDFGLAPRRRILDRLLVDAAVAAGAELVEGFTVEDVLRDGDRVTGIAGRRRGGAAERIEARMVVGADGVRSVVADRVRAAEYDAAPAGTAYWYSYWAGTDFDEFVFTREPGRLLFIAPTHDGLAMVMVGVRNDAFGEFRADVEGNYLRALDRFPEQAARVRAGRRVEKFSGSRLTRHWLRRPHGPGWALVGDAGYHRDPIVGVGMTDAIVHAGELAAALDEVLSGRCDADTALGAFHAWRDGAVRATYEYSKRISTLEPLPPELMTVVDALRHVPAQRDRFLRIFGGETDVREFFSPENCRLILAEAAQHASRA
jgi:flavin-dependent dehydrogenase